MFELMIQLGGVIGGIYLIYENYNLKQQVDQQFDMIMVMAKELKELGSPNVHIEE